MVSLADIPVTLTIKAPNQRLDDMAVECMLGWTVRKLKQHLQSVYPNSPKEDEQKLIYSGKLMDDHLTLKEILRQHEDTRNLTVHLVCMLTTSSDQARVECTNTSSSLSSSSPLPESEGLRYRGHTHSPHNTTELNAGYMNPGIYGANPMSTSGHPYSPEQYLYYQQMYSQYMSHYYQYYQTCQTNAQPTHHVPVTDVTPAPANQIPQPREVQRNAAPANQNIRMNAQGGAVMDDNEDEFGNRDWLDWVYVLCRAFVLMSIVYFYSTFQRFMLVFTLFFIVYLYRTGWFRFKQRNEEVREDEQQQQEPEQPPQEGQDEQEQEQEQEPEQNVLSGEQTEQAPIDQEPTAPSAMIVARNFCTSLFTSLVPHQPEAVNVN